eukprot:13364783-Alexandrium_andersonii.AAC.1
MSDQHSALASSLLGALIHQPAKVPASDLRSLTFLPQPAAPELLHGDVAQDLLPGRSRRGSAH